MAPTNQTATYSTLSVTKDGPVAHVELNRPKQGNAINGRMWEEIREAFARLGRDTTVRAIVLSGAGRFFTVGLDVKDPENTGALMGSSGSGDAEPKDAARKAWAFRSHIMHLQESFSVMERVPQPVIAAVHGAVIGGGIDMICAVDVRLCTSDAYFSIKEVDIGLAADVGTLQRIGHCVGSSSLVRELAYTARPLKAAEAAQAGLVSRVFDTKDEMMTEAFAMARVIANKSPVAIAGTKHNLNYSRGRPVEEGLQHMAVWNAAFLQTEDVAKAALASLQKADQPEFAKL